MNLEIKEHEMVALLSELPDEQLVPGDIGSVVMIHNNGEAFGVAFPNPAGKPRYVVVTLGRENLLKLRNLGLKLKAAE